jgi:peroxiredoxin
MDQAITGSVEPSGRSSRSAATWGAARFLLAGLGVFVAVLAAFGALLRLYDSRSPAPARHTPAPDFTLKDQAGNPHQLANYLGRAVVLAFLPGSDAETRTELQSLQGALSDLDMHGIKVFGITAQDRAANAQLHTEEKLGFPLLSDPNGLVAATYGVRGAMGRLQRATVIVGPGGLMDTTVGSVQPSRHAAQVLPLVQCCMADFAVKPSRALGSRLPNFTLRNVVTGKQDTLYSKAEPEATVVVFLSAVCPCSQGYDTRLAALAQEYRQRGVRFVGINAAGGETVAAAAEHATRNSLPFPVLKDPKQVVMERLGARMTPEVFVADGLGIVRYHGRIDDNRDASQVRRHDLREALDVLLSGKRPEKADVTPFGCAIPRLLQ